jgi:hypothetical protein
MVVEITMRQESPAFKAHEHNEIARTLMKPVSFFEVSSCPVWRSDGRNYCYGVK